MLKYNIRYIVLFSLFLFINSFVSIAQERGLLLSKYYSPNDYNAPSQNWSIVQDNRGVLYFGNSSCILEYDGNEWRKIYVPNNSNVRTIAIDNNNKLYVGAYEEFGLLLPDKNGTLTYNSLTHLIDSNYSNFGDVWDIHCFDEDVFFLTDNYLFRYKNQKFDYWTRNNERFYLSHKVNENLYVQEIGKGLLRFKNDSLVLIKKGGFFADKRIHSILPFNDKLLICTRTKGLFLYADSDEDVQIIPFSDISTNALNLNNYFIKNTFYHGIKISDNLFALSTITGGVLLVDTNWDVVDVINHESTGVISQAHYLYYQKDQALWMALANGICQVDILSPFRYWNDEKGINGAISDVASLDDKHYVSTVSGVYYSKREKDNINYSINNFTPVEGRFEQAWGFLYFILPDSNYKTTEELLNNRKAFFSPSSDKMLLLVATSTGLFQIINGKSIKISDYRAIFKIYQYKKDPSKIFLGLTNGIALMSYLNGKWTDHGMKFDINDQIRDINEDSLGNIWASASYKGVYRIKKPLLSQEHNIVNLYNTLDGLPSVQSVQFAKINNELFYLSANDYFAFNNTEDSFIIDNRPYSATTDNVEEDLPYDSLCWYRVLENTVSRYYITTQTADSIIWFSTTDGTFRYYVTNQKDYFNIYPVLIRNVLSGDSLIYNGTNYKIIESDLDSSSAGLIINPDSKINIGTTLDFKNNSLTFNYSLPFYEDESKNEYSYFLEGYDKTWSPWNFETKKEYTNLGEGDYIFKVKSRNLYTLESPVSEFKFKILPPWYRSFAAILGYIILGIILIIVIVRLYTYRLIKEKDKLEKIVIERTQEILMQKEEILVQAEHLKEANEWISAKNKKLEKQKLEIEEQRDKLALSNATKNKFFRIIAHDLRNPISTLVGSTNLIVNDFDEYNKEQTKSFIGELNKLSQTTFNLLENLLDWSSTQMGEIKFSPEPIDLYLLTDENIELVKRKIDSKNIQLKLNIEKNTIAFADENMVKTVIRNLLSNAVKFTPENGEIEISCSVDGKFVKYSVKDSGIGISKEDQKKLFRIDTHHSTPGLSNEKGSGLGLILCKEFVEKNGGKIKVSSEPQKGTTITFTLKQHTV